MKGPCFMLKKLINRIYRTCRELLFPAECLGCGQEGAYLCPDCHQKIKFLEKDNCPSLSDLNKVIAATSYHQPLVEKMIHGLKFRFIPELAEPLARLLIDCYGKIENKLDQPVIIPVPLNKKRLLERGFNQSELIAQKFAEHFRYPLLTDVVRRRRQTPHQVGLDRAQRLKNVAGAFTVDLPESIQGQNIIIIDDVLTTGATIVEIAKVLKNAQAKKIWALTVAFED